MNEKDREIIDEEPDIVTEGFVVWDGGKIPASESELGETELYYVIEEKRSGDFVNLPPIEYDESEKFIEHLERGRRNAEQSIMLKEGVFEAASKWYFHVFDKVLEQTNS